MSTTSTSTFETQSLFSLSHLTVALYSSWLHSALYNLAVNKGTSPTHLSLVEFINMMDMVLAYGIAMHQLTTMSSGKLWCSTCSTRDVASGSSWLVSPRLVMAEFPGIQIGCCLFLSVTRPIS